MEPETARTVGYVLGMGAMGYLVLKVLSRGKKPAPSPIRKDAPEIAGALKTIAVLIAVGAIAAAISWFVNGK